MEYPKLSRRKVYCKNTSHLGYDKYFVTRGEVIHFAYDDDRPQIGRVLGSVAGYFNPSQETGGSLRGWIVALTLSSTGDFAYLRYVHPDHVRCIQPENRANFGRFFFGPLGKPDDVMRYAEYGSMCASYIDLHLDTDGKLLPFGPDGRPSHVVSQDKG